MNALEQLGPDQALLLLAPFEPAPLYQVMAARGFGHKSVQTADGWEVLFSRTPATPDPAVKSAQAEAACPEIVDVDARGLEPPQPLVTILEALASLPPGAQLRARTDRRPMHLYAQLQERGFSGESEAQPDGSFITLIRAV